MRQLTQAVFGPENTSTRRQSLSASSPLPSTTSGTDRVRSALVLLSAHLAQVDAPSCILGTNWTQTAFLAYRLTETAVSRFAVWSVRSGGGDIRAQSGVICLYARYPASVLTRCVLVCLCLYGHCIAGAYGHGNRTELTRSMVVDQDEVFDMDAWRKVQVARSLSAPGCYTSATPCPVLTQYGPIRAKVLRRTRLRCVRY
eukprot:2455292-Rhodomonas_salina.3